jgi:hypothetical protein
VATSGVRVKTPVIPRLSEPASNVAGVSEKELELAVEIGTGILPGGKFTATIRRTWQGRAAAFADDLVEQSGMTLKQIEEAVLQDERLADVVANASERVVRVGDSFYRSALGTLVAAALNNDVEIDRAEELVDQLIALDATTLRVLATIYEHTDRARREFRAVAVEHIVRTSPIAVNDLDVSLARLAAGGFLDRSIEVDTAAASKNDDYAVSEVLWSYDTTDWGRFAYQTCLRHLEIATAKK